MTTQHTSGPWSVIKGSPQAGIITAPNRSLGIAEVFGGGETDIANARLIAAAPQMLAALRAALEAMGDSYDATDAAGEAGASVWDQVANAIESATGESADY